MKKVVAFLKWVVGGYVVFCAFCWMVIGISVGSKYANKGCSCFETCDKAIDEAIRNFTGEEEES